MIFSNLLRKLILIVIASSLFTNTYVSLYLLYFLLHHLLFVFDVFLLLRVVVVVLGRRRRGSSGRLWRHSTGIFLAVMGGLLAGSWRLFKEVLGNYSHDFRFEPLLIALRLGRLRWLLLLLNCC